MQIEGKVFVVTGAGSGMGRALTLNLVRRGASVAALDINEKTLNETLSLAETRQKQVSTHVVNVMDREAVFELPEKVFQQHHHIDGLINNAGIIQPFVNVNEMDYATIERVMNINFYGQLNMAKAFLPHLLERPEANITNVSSMGGFFPFPGQTIYGASKAAIKLLSEGLYTELRGTNVHITVIFPGSIDTNIDKTAGIDLSGKNYDLARKILRPVPPENAAQKIIRAIEKNRYQVYIGKDAKLIHLFYGMNPRTTTDLINQIMSVLLPR